MLSWSWRIFIEDDGDGVYSDNDDEVSQVDGDIDDNDDDDDFDDDEANLEAKNHLPTSLARWPALIKT